MKRLILMRHAEAGWNINTDDHERPLTALGIRDAKRIGLWLKEKKYIPDEVILSTSTRTIETFNGLLLECVPTFKKSLYLADANHMRSILQKLLSNTVILLGHNPGISELAYEFIQYDEKYEHFIDFPTASTLVIDFNVDHWTKIKSDSAKFVDFITPRHL